MIVVCYAANIPDTTLSLEELQPYISSLIIFTVDLPGMGQSASRQSSDRVEERKREMELATGIPTDKQRIFFGRYETVWT